MDRKTLLLERIKGNPFVQKNGGVAGIVASYGKGVETRTKNDDSGTNDIIVTANTGDIDLENERVMPGGADKSYFQANRKMFADHRYDLESGVAEARSVSAYPNPQEIKSWRIRCRLMDTPLARTIRAIVDDTNQIGVSIGFIPKDWGMPSDEERETLGGDFQTIVRSWSWFETSFTLLPCNVSCQSIVTEGKSMDMVDSADRLLSAGKIDRESAAALGMPIHAERKLFTIPETKRFFLPDGESYTITR